MLYKTLVRPHLEFASTVWSPHHKYNIDAIERVQWRATKMLATLQDLSYRQRLEKLKLETLQYRRRRADLLETYQIMNGIHNIDQSCYCSLCPSLAQTTRGHQMKVQIQHATGGRQHYFSSRVAHLWNNLSPNTINSKNINIFKNNLSHELPNKINYTFSYKPRILLRPDLTCLKPYMCAQSSKIHFCGTQSQYVSGHRKKPEPQMG